MKIKILRESLVRNKKMINYLSGKWELESPGLSYGEVIEILTRYEQIKEGLSTKKPQVQSFLYRFNGTLKPKFEPENLKSVEKFSLEHIKSLLSEYSNEPFIGEEDVVYTKENSKSTPERVEKSKNLWYGESNKVFDSGDGLRVYGIPNQKTSIAFGFYVEHTNISQTSNAAYWCVTWRPDTGANRWETYRNIGKTFYFIIDEKRNQESDKFYLSALQILENKYNVVLTSVRNDGDTTYSLEELFKIYPELKNNMDKFPSVPFTKGELSIKNKMALINETPGDEHEFRRQERPVKLSYINQGNPLTTGNSWNSMDQGLRETYIVLTTPNNYIERFPNLDLIESFRKSRKDVTLLENNGVTLGKIMDEYVKNTYKVARVSIDNPNIRIYENKKDGKFGIYHGSYGDFYRLNNIIYGPHYDEFPPEIYEDEEGNDYVVEIYSKTGTEDPSSFCAITPVNNTSANDTSAHFLSNSAWISLKDKIVKKEGREDDDPIQDIPKLDPETHIDIKEKKEF